MKTKKHGNGLNHHDVINFSNRLAASARHDNTIRASKRIEQYMRGWEDACKYFAHELRKELRYQEQVQEYLQQINRTN